jgi:penicillin-binding protein 2
MALYAMALGNKGHYFQPHAVMGIIRKATHDTVKIAHNQRTIFLKEDTWRVLREGMRGVVQEPGGTGGLARVKGVESGGKTGTAQNPHGKSHAWYIGFAPFENPRIAIVAMVENVGYGGSYAAPIAGMCIEQYLYGRLIRFDKAAQAKSPIAHTVAPKEKNITGAAPGKAEKSSSDH